VDGSGPLVPHWELEPKAGVIAPGCGQPLYRCSPPRLPSMGVVAY